MRRYAEKNPFFSKGKFCSLVRAVRCLTQQLKIQRQFLSQFISPVLANGAAGNDGSLTDADFRKIIHYYGLAVPAVLGEAFCVLRGTQMTNQERWASTCQGAMTGLFDDFFDNDYLDAHQVEAKISPDYKPRDTEKSNEKLFTTFYDKALAHVQDKELLRNALFTVHEAQVRSRKQTDPSLSINELMAITLEKGGTSLLFYRTVFHPASSPQETAVLYHLGGTMQLANDIFDVFKDREKNIRTLMTETSSVEAIRTLLLQRMEEGYSLAYALPLPRQKVRRFLSFLSIGIFSRCFVCLDHLEKNEKLTNQKFELSAYHRQQLVCDMDTKKNMLRSAAYHMSTFI